MSVVIVPDPAGGSGVPFVFIDPAYYSLVISESHTHTAEITEHPVETGATVSDNISTKPNELTIELISTNTPNKPGVYGVTVKYQLDIPPLPLILSESALIEAGISAIGDALFGASKPPVATVLGWTQEFDAISEMHDALVAIWESKSLCGVATSTKTYDDMAVKNVKYDRKVKGKGAFSVTFGRVNTVSSQTVAAPVPLEPRGKGIASKGSQSTGDTKDGAKAESLLEQAKNAVKALVK